MKAELVPENGDPPIPILRDVTLLGRHEDCDVVVEHPSLSKRHCLLVKTDGLLVIRDLATTNGTKVKGQRVRWAALLPEDRVSFGAYKVRIYLGSDEMPAPSEQRQARNGVGGSRAPAVIARGGAGLSPPSKNTGASPPSQPPRLAPSGFPEPSPHEGNPAVEWDTVLPSGVSHGAAAAEPAVLKGGLEIVDDRAGAGDGGGGIFEGSFELVDDDDDIIELD